MSRLARAPSLIGLAVACSLLCGGPRIAAATELRCHYAYGGEDKVLNVKPAVDPYTEGAVKVGSYLLLRAVWQRVPASLAALQVYTYSVNTETPVMIHQGTWPEAHFTLRGAHGFTGLQRAFDAQSGSEVQYWCEADGASPP